MHEANWKQSLVLGYFLLRSITFLYFSPTSVTPPQPRIMELEALLGQIGELEKASSDLPRCSVISHVNDRAIVSKSKEFWKRLCAIR